MRSSYCATAACWARTAGNCLQRPLLVGMYAPLELRPLPSDRSIVILGLEKVSLLHFFFFNLSLTHLISEAKKIVIISAMMKNSRFASALHNSTTILSMPVYLAQKHLLVERFTCTLTHIWLHRQVKQTSSINILLNPV